MTGIEVVAKIVGERVGRSEWLGVLVREHAATVEFPALLRRLPPNLRLPAAARALAVVPDQPKLVRPIVDALTQGLGKSRLLQRLLDLQSRVNQCSVLDAMVNAAEKRTRLKCPKCELKLTRPALIRHLWLKHRLMFDRGRARDPGPLVEAAVQAAAITDDPLTLDTAYELAGVCYPAVEAVQIHQAITSRLEADAEELQPLLERARESNAGLCPRCLSQLPNLLPPLPPLLVVSQGRLLGESYSLDLGPVSASRKRAVRWALVVAIVGLLSLLIVAKPLPVLAMTIFAMVIVYGVIVSRGPTGVQVEDAVVDAAWTDLVPRVGRTPAAVEFLTRLCRTSLDHGTTAVRTDAVWSQVEQAAVLSGKGIAYLQWFAAVRVLQAFDAGRIGRDWIPSLVGMIAPLFRAEASPTYAEAVAEILLHTDALTDADGARLRVALVGEAFAAGLTPADLGAIVDACPQLGRLYAGTEDWFRVLHGVWRERNRRGWEKVGEARTVFDFAGNPASGRTLASYPDTLLVFRFDESFDRELGPVLIGRRGVTVSDVTASDLNTAVEVDGERLVYGVQTIETRRKLPKKVATLLTNWLQYREELLAAERPASRTERVTAILAPMVQECPLCRIRCLIKVGEVCVSV